MTTRKSSSSGAGEARLGRFFAAELGCEPALLDKPGTHLLSPSRRGEPCWCEFVLPFLLIGRNGSTVVSLDQDLSRVLQNALDVESAGLDAIVAVLQDTVAASYPDAQCLSGRALYCESEWFTPVESRATEMLRPHDPVWEAFTEHFDGPVFVVRREGGAVAAWSAIKLKSDDVWEIAVTTDRAHRGRGLAKVVVSAATRYILEAGRVPLYVHAEENVPSRLVAEALGYREYAREAYCSLRDSASTGMW